MILVFSRVGLWLSDRRYRLIVILYLERRNAKLAAKWGIA
jgi:hypothetical protein